MGAAPSSVLLLRLLACGCFVGSAAAGLQAPSQETGGDCHRHDDGANGSCPAVAKGAGSDAAGRSRVSADVFWAEMKKRGLQLKMRRRTVEEKRPGQGSHNRSAMVLTDDVFYGRAIMKIPRHALLSIETAPDLELRRELNGFLFEGTPRALERYNVTGEDAAHLLSLAYPLIAERRDNASVFRPWIEATVEERLTVLELTERQQRVLVGTTVEGAYEEMARNRYLIEHTATNLSYFRTRPVSSDEAAWALAVIMRHSRVVHPHQDVRESRAPRMYLIPLKELLDVRLNPDPGLAVPFQEEILLENGKREEEMVVQIARRDMPKGEEVFLWPGRLSNSEMAVRHGITFSRNPIGIGRNITQPPNWSPHPESKVRKEYNKFNCSSLDSFEMRFSPQGYPMQAFVRCYRVSWFLSNGWYTPGYVSRIRELNTWPPVKKYSKDDWLAWTQADAEVNRMILHYCKDMRQQLKDTMDAQIAEDFRKSRDSVDRLVWQLRKEESKTFKECIAVASKISS